MCGDCPRLKSGDSVNDAVMAVALRVLCSVSTDHNLLHAFVYYEYGYPILSIWHSTVASRPLIALD